MNILLNYKKLWILLISKIKEWDHITMISRTHGQPAVPIAMGKEIHVFLYRLELQFFILKDCQILW